jgi:probable F420-dependent oxidoreductase
VKLGVIFPQTESTADPGALREYIQSVEEIGFEHIGFYDHVLGASPDRPGGWLGPYTHEHLFHEVMVTLGYIAAITTEIELATEVLVLPQRQTALVAKQAAEVDLLSGGRLRLGVGLGWNRVEMEALGMDFATRGRRLEEQVEVMRRLWADPLVDFEGEFHVLPKVGLNPLPGRPIPVWLGGSAEDAKLRAARIADGWMMNTPTEPDPPGALQHMREILVGLGRDPAAFGVEVRVGIRGGVEKATTRLAEWDERGVSHATINTMGAGLAWPAGHVEALRKLRQALSLTGPPAAP